MARSREIALATVVVVIFLGGALAVFVWWDTTGSWNSQPVTHVELVEVDELHAIAVMGGCHPEYRASAVETSERVVVLLETRGERKGACLGGAQVDLRAPLDDRAVFDATTGAEVSIVD